MTLLGAVQSLGMVEIATVSWINIRQIGAQHVAYSRWLCCSPWAVFFWLKNFATGRQGFGRIKNGYLKVRFPSRTRFRKLHFSKILENLDFAYVAATEGDASAIWIIETHAGSDEERNTWLRPVMALEGRQTKG